jgi:hypothetical protein
MDFAPIAVSFGIKKLITAAFGSPFLLALKVCCWPVSALHEQASM